MMAAGTSPRPNGPRQASRFDASRRVRRCKPGDDMNAAQQLHDLGQSLWLDNITRALLGSGTLARYIRDLAVTGLTSNPTIFDQAIKEGDHYDAAIRDKAQAGESGEAL